jgi:hypothetical protein
MRFVINELSASDRSVKNVIVSFIIPETLQPDSVQILRSNLEQLLKM